MKKFLAIFIIICIAVTFAACSSKEYVDVVVTAPVTDESGEQVTDNNGVGVTEAVTDDSGKEVTTSVKKSETTTAKPDETTSTTEKGKESTKKSDKGKKETTDKKDTTKKDDTTKKETTKKNGKETTKKETTEKETTKKETTTKPTTTAAPKKREVTALIYLPLKELTPSRLKVKYRVRNGKEWGDWKEYKFEDPENKLKKLNYKDVILDKSVVECDLGKIKGEVRVACELEGLELSDNIEQIDAYTDIIELHPYSGIENIDGIDD